MDVNRPWLAILLIVVLGADAIASGIPIQYVKDDLARLRVPPELQRALPIVKAVAVIGMIIGLWQPWLGLLACIGMVLYFCVAFWFHYRMSDPIPNYIPAAGFTTLVITTLLLSYL